LQLVEITSGLIWRKLALSVLSTRSFETLSSFKVGCDGAEPFYPLIATTRETSLAQIPLPAERHAAATGALAEAQDRPQSLCRIYTDKI